MFADEGGAVTFVERYIRHLKLSSTQIPQLLQLAPAHSQLRNPGSMECGKTFGAIVCKRFSDSSKLVIA